MCFLCVPGGGFFLPWMNPPLRCYDFGNPVRCVFFLEQPAPKNYQLSREKTQNLRASLVSQGRTGGFLEQTLASKNRTVAPPEPSIAAVSRHKRGISTSSSASQSAASTSSSSSSAPGTPKSRVPPSTKNQQQVVPRLNLTGPAPLAHDRQGCCCCCLCLSNVALLLLK